ncbi:MAG: hypothetical protein H6577_10270 [Lewinellaceae bacterium]|nr:hypothetical protein [Saprospiraceae bacterium]MCB9338501.1 hypothetical protein [Lewinellaceae bacterium]
MVKLFFHRYFLRKTTEVDMEGEGQVITCRKIFAPLILFNNAGKATGTSGFPKTAPKKRFLKKYILYFHRACFAAS